MNIYIFAIIGLIVGVVVGWFTPLHIPASYANYTSVAVSNFISGFFSNVILAVVLVYIGDLIGINLYYVALIGFGLRVFINLAAIRKNIMTKRF